MEVVIALLAGVLALLVYCWYLQMTYWRRLGIPHNEPKAFAGNMSEWRNKTKHIAHIFKETYDQFKGSGPFAGFYFFFGKTVVVLDLDLVKNILIKDFQNFSDRGLYHNERDDPLTGNLFFTAGDRWHHLRHKMSPTFTSGKMKFMFPTVVKIGQELTNTFSEKVKSTANGTHKVIEITDLLSRYTADVIGRCAFGLNCNSLHNPEAEFVMMGKRFLNEPRHSRFIESIIFSFPNMGRKLGMRIINQSVHDFYLRIVRETIQYREKNNVRRNDFMDMMLDLKNGQSSKDEQGHDMESLSVEEIAAQAFVFFIAGYETSSTTMSFALYELAQHQDIQEKLRNEINEVFAKHNGEFTYECMKEMKYLDQTIDETLRMHPVLAHLIRKTRDRYETSDPKYFIDKNVVVIIPVLGIHYNPEYYPEPEKFNPDRFLPEEIKKRPHCTWLPFGEGPRNCIGLRFGKMQTSIGLAYLLKNFKFSVASETQIPYNVIKTNFIMGPESIKLMVEKI